MISLNEVKSLLDTFESLNGHHLQKDVKLLCAKAVAEYLTQDDKDRLTPIEAELLKENPANKIKVIKMVRERTGFNLADSKEVVDNHMPT